MPTAQRIQPAPQPAFFIGLAPLAGYSDMPFRTLCYEGGADFACTEMVSAKGLCYHNQNTVTLLEVDPEEKNLAIQLFGHDEGDLTRAIQEAVNPNPAFSRVNLNMGCPAPKITKNGDGSALMADPLQAGRVVEAMVKASEKPVTVKIRLGQDDDHINYLEIGHICQEAGAQAIALHPRTREAGYSGQADWEAIGQLKAALSIPVFGNGDVRTPEDARAMLELTGCDGILIGRGAMGKPFLFQQVHDYLATGTYTEPSFADRVDLLLDHYQREIAWRGEARAVKEMRKQLFAYIGGFPYAARLRQQLMVLDSFAEIEEILRTAQA